VTTEGIFITELDPGPGIRLAVKDLFDTAGIRTTYGSVVFAEHVPTATAEAVRRVEAAGYANLGKTNLHEFAYGVTSQNPHYGTVPNPAAPGRTSGGSSGGTAAAIVAGLCDVGLGTDSGGSIRIPAHCCGIAGFKPTYGLVSLDGVFPLAPSFDHAGPMARDVGGCVELMQALVPGFAVEPVALDELAVGVAWTDAAEPLVRERVEAAAALFPRGRPLSFPEPVGTTAAFMRDVAGVHRELFEEHADLYGANVRTKLERCLAVSDGEAEAAAAARHEYRRLAEDALDGADLLVVPTMMLVAPPADVDDLAWRDRIVRFTYPFNLLGWPALALPCGPAEHGLPASLQLVGRPGDDAHVLAAGLALEQALAAA
jgi:aspartyl-tRNA(Asn)/glutamyl-tRNA(Gln) amidotransferase subunit A